MQSQCIYCGAEGDLTICPNCSSFQSRQRGQTFPEIEAAVLAGGPAQRPSEYSGGTDSGTQQVVLFSEQKKSRCWAHSLKCSRVCTIYGHVCDETGFEPLGLCRGHVREILGEVNDG